MARKLDEIRIRGLRVFAHHGVFEEETRLGQMFVVNATLYTSTRRGGLADALEQTISYADVCLFLTEYLQKNTWKLLEAAVEHACRALLLKFPLIHEVELELEKPAAPLPLPFDSVSVRVRRGWHRAFVALGSNMGDKQGYLNGAVAALRADDCVRVKQVSSYRVTAPYGGVEQDDFLNAAMEIETLYDPEELLDVLFYDDLVQDDPALILPHPDLHNRDFVLGPMAELAPNYVHPVLHKTMKQLLNELPSAEE